MDVKKIQKRDMQAQKRELQAQKREMYVNQVQIFPISLKVDTLPTYMDNQLKIQIYKRLLKDQIDLLNIRIMTQTRYIYKMLHIFIHVATDWKESYHSRNQQRVPRRDFAKNRWKASVLKYLQKVVQQIAVSLSTDLNQASYINCFSDLEQFLQSYTRKTYAISESIYSSALFIKGRDPSGHSMQLDTYADYFPQLALTFINTFSLGLFGKGPIFPGVSSTKKKNSAEYFAQLAYKNRFSWQILDQNGAIRALKEGRVITAQFFLKDVWHAFSIIGVDQQSKCWIVKRVQDKSIYGRHQVFTKLKMEINYIEYLNVKVWPCHLTPYQIEFYKTYLDKNIQKLKKIKDQHLSNSEMRNSISRILEEYRMRKKLDHQLYSFC